MKPSGPTGVLELGEAVGHGDFVLLVAWKWEKQDTFPIHIISFAHVFVLPSIFVETKFCTGTVVFVCSFGVCIDGVFVLFMERVGYFGSR